MTDFLFIVGLASIVTGVALVSGPAAFIVGGALICALAVLARRGAVRPTGERDE